MLVEDFEDLDDLDLRGSLFFGPREPAARYAEERADVVIPRTADGFGEGLVEGADDRAAVLLFEPELVPLRVRLVQEPDALDLLDTQRLDTL
jgi:hypothetical protein